MVNITDGRKIPDDWLDKSVPFDRSSPVSGIYVIRCKTNGKFYLGSSKSIKHRLKCHLLQLKHGKHHSKKLQYAWNKYGACDFEILVVEDVRPDDLTNREQEYLDQLKPYRQGVGYNIMNIAYQPVRESNSDLHRARISAALKGRVLPRESIEKIRLANTGKKRPIDAILRTAAGRRKPIVQITTDGKVYAIFNSAKDAWMSLGMKSHTYLSTGMKKPNSIIKGFYWRWFKFGCEVGSLYPGWEAPPQRESPLKPMLGECNANAKLTESKVRQMRMLNDKFGISSVELAPWFGVTYRTVIRVLKRSAWKQVA